MSLRQPSLHLFLGSCLFAAFTLLAAAGCKQGGAAAALDAKAFEPTGIAEVDKLTALLKDNRRNDSLWALRGKALYEADRFDEAIRDFKYAISLDSNRLDYYHALADAQLDFNQSKEGIATLETVVRRAPKRIPSLLKLSEFELIVKQFSQAERTANRVLDVESGNAEGFFMLGRIYKDMTDTVKALQNFQKAVELNPQHFDAYMQLAIITGKKHLPISLQYINNALRIDSASSEARYAKAMYLQSEPKPNYAAAIALYDKIIEHDPHYTAAMLNKGILLLEQNKLDEAMRQFETSTKVEPTFAKGYYYQSIVADKKGDKARAKSLLEQAQTFDPNLKKE